MEQTSNGVKALATRSLFFFALVFFVVSFCMTLMDFFVLPLRSASGLRHADYAPTRFGI